MADSSDIRAKVAQYFVNKKVQELESTNPKIKIGDWTYLQTLPQLQEQERKRSAQSIYQGDQEPELHIQDEASQLPPLFPTPIGDHVSWKDLLKLEESRRVVDPDKPSGFPKDRPTGSFPTDPTFPSWYCVAIIGAGVAGLRTAKLLQDMRIPYKIFEASERPGGRVFTYQFPSSGSPGKHDYYDVGAMRFPDNDANKRTFNLFKELGLDSKLVEYVLSRDDNIRHYNGKKTTASGARTNGDHFEDKIVPKEYLNKVYFDKLLKKDVFGVDACTAAAFNPFRKALIDNFEKGWKELMKYDWASTRSYLAREMKPEYPLSVVHWMETRSSGTSGYDRAFSEDILDSLEFDDPRKGVNWKCLDGGSKLLIDAMLAQLTTKPLYGHQVTDVRLVYRLIHECFPNQIRWPFLFPLMKVSIEGQADEYFGHVVSTTTFANLGTINTEGVPMTYKQRHAIRTLNYGPAIKVGIRFNTRWWEQNGLTQRGGSSYTDRQSRVIVYPSAGLGEAGPGVLMATYNWHQDATRFGALVEKSDWSKQHEPGRTPPPSEKLLLNQIYGDLATLHNVPVEKLRDDTLDYHAFNWYQNPFTMGAYAHFAPGQFGTFFADIVKPAACGRFHFAGEVASAHHAWVAGALDSAERVVKEILRWDCPILLDQFKDKYGRSSVFSDEKSEEAAFASGVYSQEMEQVDNVEASKYEL